jgi:hypothetical protein
MGKYIYLRSNKIITLINTYSVIYLAIGGQEGVDAGGGKLDDNSYLGSISDF